MISIVWYKEEFVIEQADRVAPIIAMIIVMIGCVENKLVALDL